MQFLNLKDSSPSLPPTIENVFHANPALSLLDSSLSDVVLGSDKDIYCRKCNKDKYCQSTAVAYSDPKSITAEDGKGCPRCKGLVFTAEQVTEKGRIYHFGCFSCNKCKRPLTNRVI